MTICVPTGTDWSAKFDADALQSMRDNPTEAANLELAEVLAWSLLAQLTAYSIGTCPIAVRPCAAACTPETGYLTAPVIGGGGLPLATIGRPYPFVSGGRWYNACACRSAGDCSCSALSEVLLPGPVGGIVKIMVDGAELPRSAYRIDNGYRLVRTDGGTWPVCQDMSLGEDEPGAFVVVYYRGAAPNIMTRAAAGALAIEYYAAIGGEDCRLPWNLVAATREGETYDFGEDGGIDAVVQMMPVVASVVRIYNPNGLKTRPRVIVPGGDRERVTPWRR